MCTITLLERASYGQEKRGERTAAFKRDRRGGALGKLGGSTIEVRFAHSDRIPPKDIGEHLQGSPASVRHKHQKIRI